MAAASIGIPTVGGVQNSLVNYAMGAAGGFVFNFVSKMTGSGLIGGAVAAGLAGATLKGPAGQTIATMAGFAVGASGFQGLNLPGFLGGGGGGDELSVL